MKKRRLVWIVAVVSFLVLGFLIRNSLLHFGKNQDKPMQVKQEPILPIPDLTTDKATICHAILALTTRLPDDYTKAKRRFDLLKVARRQNLPEDEILESLQFMADRYESVYEIEKDKFSHSLLEQLGYIHCFLGNSERGVTLFQQVVNRDLAVNKGRHQMIVRYLIDHDLMDAARKMFVLLPKGEQNREIYLKSRAFNEPLPTPSPTVVQTYSLDENLDNIPPLLEMSDDLQRHRVFHQLAAMIRKGQLDLADQATEKLRADEYSRIFSTDMREYEFEHYMERMLTLAELDYLQGRTDRFSEKQQMFEQQLDLWTAAENSRYDEMMKHWDGKQGAPPEPRYLWFPFTLQMKLIQIHIAAGELETSIQSLREIKRSSTPPNSTFNAICDALFQKKEYARIQELIKEFYPKQYDQQISCCIIYDKLLEAGEKAESERWAEQFQIPSEMRLNRDITFAIRQRDFEKAVSEIGRLQDVNSKIAFLFMILNSDYDIDKIEQ